MRTSIGHNKWFLISLAVVCIGLIWMVAGDKLGDEKKVAGTMAEEETITLENMEAAWSEESSVQPNHGRMDGTFGVTVNAVNRTNTIQEEQLTLYFSRDQNFSAEEDCQIDQRSVILEPSGTTAVRFRVPARLTDCIDAGPWFAAVYVDEGLWSALETVYTVENGEAEIEIQSMAPDVAPRGTVELQLLVNRPATTSGFDGLYDFPVDVWLQQEETLCLIEAEGLTVPRYPGLPSTQSWQATEVSLKIELQNAIKIDPTSLVNSPFSLTERLETVRGCVDCPAPVQEGNCRLSEGPLELTIGPTISGFHVVQETFLHAQPVVVEPGSFDVTVYAGEVAHISRTAYNPSVQEVTWSSSSVNNEAWLIGMENQPFPSRTPSTVGFTVSAVDLEPGVYDATVHITTTDYYGTESTLEVEVTVLPSRSVVTDTEADSELPSSVSLGNYPNPFNPTTTIRFELPEREQISLVVFDLTGRQIRILNDGELSAGLHEFRFDAGELPSGTYLYRLTTPTESLTGKMILVK